MSTLGSFIWSIADQLRGPYLPNQYGTSNYSFANLLAEYDPAATGSVARRRRHAGRHQ